MLPESVAIGIVTKAVEFLFGEAKVTIDEIRQRRKDDPGAEALPMLPDSAVETTKETVSAWETKNLRLIDDPEEVNFLLKQIEVFRFNRRHNLDIHNKMGILTPQHIMHELRGAEDGIRDYTQRLKAFVENVYGHKINIVGLS